MTTNFPLSIEQKCIFLDNNRPIVHNHCKQLLLNLLVVLGGHCDHLSVASVLLNNKTTQLDYGLITQNTGNVITHNFLEVDDGELILKFLVAQLYIIRVCPVHPSKYKSNKKFFSLLIFKHGQAFKLS